MLSRRRYNLFCLYQTSASPAGSFTGAVFIQYLKRLSCHMESKSHLSINSLTLIRFQVHVSLILTKESPFLEPLIMQLKRMEQSGVLENIRKRYYPSTVNDCKESKVALGYNQLWFPIIILFLGTFFSVILGCCEIGYQKIYQN